MSAKKKPATADLISMIYESSAEIRADIKEIKGHISSIQMTSKEQQLILEEHIRRTELNEKAILKLEEKDNSIINTLSERVAPVERHIAMWSGAGKVLVVLSSIAAAAYSIIRLVGVTF